jgi:hypothetical protein
MMDNLYYKYVKLVSGDGIICTTLDNYENLYDLKTIKVSSPVVLNPVRIPRGDVLVESYIMYPWFSFSEETEYTIPTAQILFAVNIKETLKKNYLTYLSNREDEGDDELIDDDEFEEDEELFNTLLNTLGDEIHEDKENQESGDGFNIGRVGRTTKRLH